MKLVLVALCVIAAVAALFIRPPQIAPPPVSGTTPSIAEPPASGSPSFAGGHDAGRTRRSAASGGRRAASSGGAPVVYVAGDVRRPGVYTLAPGSRAVDALARAGGALPDADLVAVNLAAPLADGDEVAVPKIGSDAAQRRRRGGGRRPRAAHGGHRNARTRPRTADATPADDLEASPQIDINHADASELEMVPGIGPALAARIIAYREENGPFTSLDELADVDGVSTRVEDALSRSAIIR